MFFLFLKGTFNLMFLKGLKEQIFKQYQYVDCIRGMLNSLRNVQRIQQNL